MDVTANQGLMAPSWDNGVTRLYHADARRIPLADESVHCVVTSPPYWNLRDYGLAPSVWGGDSGCPHYWLDGVVAPGARSSDRKSGPKQQNANRRDGIPTSAFCGECSAWLGALGLEPTVDLYVAHIVEIFREVWRALRTDGTCWINLGDSYSGRRDGKLKPKDLVGMPWRIAFALQDDGWWLRSPGIWEKPNPMPESVTDRLTTSHEYVFMLTKSGDRLYWAHPGRPGVRTKPPADYRYVCDETGEELEAPPKAWRAKDSGWRRVNLWQGHDYFFDGHAIREPLAEASVARISQATFWQQQGGPKDYSNGVNPSRSTLEETMEVTTPDNVLVSGRLGNGGVVSVHVAAIPWHSSDGPSMQVFGRDGTLVYHGSHIDYSRLEGARGNESALQEIPVPDRLVWVPADVPQGPPFNVAQMYRRLAGAIRTGGPVEPDFDFAVRRHELLESIQVASDQGRAQSVASAGSQWARVTGDW